MQFSQGAEKFGDARPVTQEANPIPNAAKRVASNYLVPFVIRGYELRGFVEEQTPEQRYREIIAWFGLQPLLDIQSNLRALRKLLKQRTESNAEERERIRDLARITKNAVREWDENKISLWFNENVTTSLDNTLVLESVSPNDKGYNELVNRKRAEQENLGVSAMQNLLASFERSYSIDSTDHAKEVGAIPKFETAVAEYSAATEKESKERGIASQAIFAKLWTAAKEIFDDRSLSLALCPVCETKLSSSPIGPQAAIAASLEIKLAELSAYRAASNEARNHAEILSKAHQSLSERLEGLTEALEAEGYAHRSTAIAGYAQDVKKWKQGMPAPDNTAAVGELLALHRQLGTEKKLLLERQGEHTYAKALDVATSIIDLRTELRRIGRKKEELLKLNAELDRQCNAINKAVAQHVSECIAALRNKINELYGDIQGDGSDAPPIYLTLPDEDDTNQQRMQLLIDFSENRKGVNPTGYLSDSQIHALALSLRLSAIRTFNPSVPMIVLDDVVTSYDADHRKNIAAMLAKHFDEYQIVVLTHDERFFALLQDHLPPANWIFRRITELRPDFGPTFQDHRTSDEVITEKLQSGESAANEIRQAEEEWLLDLCRGFKVSLAIRPIDRPYHYDRHELASALASFLKDRHISVPQVPGIANSFLTSLQKGDIENFGSHFSDNPNAVGSLGDEKARWNEFIFFRNRFKCPKCGRAKFIRLEPLPLPVCKNCQTPFSFSPSVVPNSAPVESSK
jgi:hypothetical protein